MRLCAFLMCVTILRPGFLLAQDKEAVMVTHEGSDRAGNQLTFELREAIRRSAGYELAESWKDADFQVVIFSLDLPNTNGIASAAGFTYVAKHANDSAPVYIDSTIALVSTATAPSIAHDAIATLDRAVALVRK